MEGAQSHNLAQETLLTLLKRCEELAPHAHNAASMRDLAEAYAWLLYPNQSHGSVIGTPRA
jgi:hypothetical protein